MSSECPDSIQKGFRFSANQGYIFDANLYVDDVDKGEIDFQLMDIIYLENYYFIRLGITDHPSVRNELTLKGIHLKVGEKYKLVDLSENDLEVDTSFALEPDVSLEQRKHSGPLDVSYNEALENGSNLIGMHFSYSFEDISSGGVKKVSVICWTFQFLTNPPVSAN